MTDRVHQCRLSRYFGLKFGSEGMGGNYGFNDEDDEAKIREKGEKNHL